MDKTNQATAPPTPRGGGSGGDPWATAAVYEEGTREEALTHTEGETFTMPQTNTSQTNNARASEILTALSNLGSVISTKAREVDQQTGISTKVADFKANVNEKYHVSEKWGNFTAATRQKTHEIDEKYHVSEKWSNLRGRVAARVEKIKEDRRKRTGSAGEGGSNNNM